MNETRRTVLIVDDNLDLLEMLRDGLSTEFTVRVARDGVEGLESVAESPPDCAVIDVKMPDINGLQLIRAVRGDPATMGIPLIILTAMPEEQGLLTGLLSGADRYLTKPVLPSELIPVINEVIAIGQSERERRLSALLEQEDL